MSGSGYIFECLRKTTNQKLFKEAVKEVFDLLLSQEKIEWVRTEEGMSEHPDYSASVTLKFRGQRDTINVYLYIKDEDPYLSLYSKEYIAVGGLDLSILELFEKVSGIALGSKTQK